MLTVPTHRALTEPERAILERTPGAVRRARPAGGHGGLLLCRRTHFAVNGAAEPCACAFHGVLTPASAHTLAAHFERLDPFSREELAAAGFSEHLTGRLVLTKEMRETGRGRRAARRRERRGARHGGEPAFALGRIGRDAGEVLAARFREAARRMDEARATRRGPATGRRLPGLPWRRGPRRGERRFSRDDCSAAVCSFTRRIREVTQKRSDPEKNSLESTRE